MGSAQLALGGQIHAAFPSVNDALEDLISYFEICRDNGGLRILKGKRKTDETVLNDIRSGHLAKCQEFLGKAEPRDADYDKKLGDKEMASWFRSTVDEEEKKVSV